MLSGGNTPYGTDVDLSDGLDRGYGSNGQQSRKGLVRSQRSITGAWMAQMEAAPRRAPRGGGGPAARPSHFRGVQAPFGTDVDVRRG